MRGRAGRLTVAMAASASTAQASAVCSDPPATHSSFDIVRNEMVDEFGVRAVMYKHKKSGAEVLSIEAPDENKVFGITFRTPPKDSTGVPHILEHSVLCGSRKYRTKEPFVELLKGSLQTFLNAFTYPDRTCYPVASCNQKDFYNLINVYLDAVLHPRAIRDELVLQQEGWHLELDSPDQPLTYKGVVYNEMKGVYSSPESRLARAAQQALFTDNTYGVDSGGDPLRIPDLTFSDFKAFHSEFYHPSNSRIFFYGDDPVPKRLELLDSYLSEFNAITPDSKIGIQERRKIQKRVVEKFPAAEGEQAEKHMVQVNWLLNEKPFTPKEQLALSVLDHLLLGTPSSTLRKALTDSGLGSAVIGGGLSDELSQATFSVGLKGVKPEDVAAVEQLVTKTLEKIQAEGVEESAVEASLNSIEFQLREFNTGSFPRGLSFMLGAMSAWIYDRDPMSNLRFEEPLASLKADLAEGKPVFTDLLTSLIINNDHKVTVEMIPDTELEQKQVAEEESRLASIKESMSSSEIDEVIEMTRRLQEAQAAHDSAEDLATIPALAISDLPKAAPELPNDVSTMQGVTVLRHEVPSNGIIYADVGLDLSQLPAADLPLVNLFARCLLETGTTEEDEVSLSRRIGSRTGGVTTSTLTGVRVPADDTVATGDDMVHRLFIRGKAVAGRADDLFGVVNDVLTSCRLDNKKRIIEMLKESQARMEASLVSAGHAFAATRLSAAHTTAGRLLEQTGGVESLAALKALLAMAESDWPVVQARLEAIRAQLLTKSSLLVNLSGDAATLKAVDPALEGFLSGLPKDGDVPASKLANWKADLPVMPTGNEGFYLPTQVNYVGHGGRLYSPGEQVSGSTSVVSRWLRNGYLWDTVRVIGGAYGGFCRFSPLTGSFSYLSYRDPNLVKTIENYDGAADFLQTHDLSSEALSQAIIGTVGDLDAPLSPDQKGWEAMRRHLVGETAEQRQEWRKQVLATTANDFKEFGDRLKGMKTQSVVFGSKKAIEDANAELSEEEQFDLKGLL